MSNRRVAFRLVIAACVATMAATLLVGRAFPASPPPPIPGTPQVTATAQDSGVQLYWPAIVVPGDSITYTVQRAPAADGPWTTIKAGLASDVFVDSGRLNRLPLWYQVQAVDTTPSVPVSGTVIRNRDGHAAAFPLRLGLQ